MKIFKIISALVIFFTSAALYICNENKIYNSILMHVPTLTHDKILKTQTESDIELVKSVDSSSSELNGTWYGLCPKNSAIKSVDDFYNRVTKDPTLSLYFGDFDWKSAVIKSLPQEMYAKVSHRKYGIIQQSSKYILLPKGDNYITDGKRRMRTYCCNDIVFASPGEVSPSIFDYQPYASSEVENIFPLLTDPLIYHNRNVGIIYNGTSTPEPSTLILYSLGLPILFYKLKKRLKNEKL